MQESNYTPNLIGAAYQALDEIFQAGLYYKKAGIVIDNLSDANSLQLNLASALKSKSSLLESEEKVKKVTDALNNHFGVNTIFWASMGSQKSKTKIKQEQSPWRAKQSQRSPSYTTDWGSLALVH